MALHPIHFAQMSGLQYDKQANLCWGDIQGYPVYVKIVPRRDTVIFRLNAKRAETETESQLQAAIVEWSASHAGVSGFGYQENCLAAAVSLTPRDTDSNLAMRVAELVQFAVQHGMIPCCAFCGAEYGYRHYLLDEDGVSACDACRPRLEMRMQEIREEKAAVPSNPLGMLLGAVIGAAAVFILTFFVLKLSYLSFLTGYAGLFIGFYAMKRLGKKVTVAGTVICTVLCLAAGLAAPLLHFASLMAEHNMDNLQTATEICEGYQGLNEMLAEFTDEEIAELEEITGESLDINSYRGHYEEAKLVIENLTVSDCLKNFKVLLDCDIYRDLKPELIKCILFAVLSILAGAAITAPPLLRESKGIHTMRELGA